MQVLDQRPQVRGTRRAGGRELGDDEASAGDLRDAESGVIGGDGTWCKVAFARSISMEESVRRFKVGKVDTCVDEALAGSDDPDVAEGEFVDVEAIRAVELSVDVYGGRSRIEEVELDAEDAGEDRVDVLGSDVGCDGRQRSSGVVREELVGDGTEPLRRR